MELIQRRFQRAIKLSIDNQHEKTLITNEDRHKIIGKILCGKVVDGKVIVDEDEKIPFDEDLIVMLSECSRLFEVKKSDDESYNANVWLINKLQNQLQEMSLKVMDESVIREKDDEIEYLEQKVKKMKKVIAKITDDDDDDEDTFENFLEVKQLKKQLNQAKSELSRANEKLDSIRNTMKHWTNHSFVDNI